jgi:hypothetical protein
MTGMQVPVKAVADRASDAADKLKLTDNNASSADQEKYDVYLSDTTPRPSGTPV